MPTRSRRPRPKPAAAKRAPASVELPYERAERLVAQLLTAARLDDDGAQLGTYAGVASLDRRTAGTVIAMLARTVVVVSETSAEELLA